MTLELESVDLKSACVGDTEAFRTGAHLREIAYFAVHRHSKSDGEHPAAIGLSVHQVPWKDRP